MARRNNKTNKKNAVAPVITAAEEKTVEQLFTEADELWENSLTKRLISEDELKLAKEIADGCVAIAKKHEGKAMSKKTDGLAAYRALQQEAKALGVKANGKTAELQARIERAKAGKADTKDMAAKKVESTVERSVSYKDLQKAVSDLCKASANLDAARKEKGYKATGYAGLYAIVLLADDMNIKVDAALIADAARNG